MTMFKRISKTTVAILVAGLVFAGTHAWAAIFIDNATSGCSNGSTSYNPADRTCSGGSDTVYTSWANAVSGVSASATINVRAGTAYTENNINITKANTTWQKYSSDASKPVIDGAYVRPGTDYSHLVSIRADGVTLDGIEIKQTGPLSKLNQRAVSLWGTEGVTVKNCYIHDTSDSAIDCDSAVSFLLEDNEIAETNQCLVGAWGGTCAAAFSWSGGIFIQDSSVDAQGASNGVVRGNYLHDNRGESIQVIRNATNITIEENELYGPGGYPALYFHGAQNVTIRNNIVHGFNWAGILLAAEEPQYDSNTVRVYGNLVSYCGKGIGICSDGLCYGSDTPKNIYIHNNTVVESRVYSFNIYSGRARSDQHIKNNIFWHGTTGSIADAPSGASFSTNLWSVPPDADVRASNDPRYPTYTSLSLAEYLTKSTGWDSVAEGALSASSFDLKETATYALNTGAWLTNITSATGSGTSFVVADSRYFMAGDAIMVQGNASAVTITDINYGTHTITVDNSVSWSQAPPALTGVAFRFSGALPDLGGRESGLITEPEDPEAGWSILYVTTEELVGEDGAASNAIDDDQSTIWHTQWYNCIPSCVEHPHVIDIDLDESKYLTGLSYLPRQDGSVNGTIAQYEVYVSSDGVTWGSPVASGTWAASTTLKTAEFAGVNAQYIRLKSLTEINGREWTSAAEISIIEGTPPGGGGGWPEGVPEPTWKWHLADNSGAAEIGTAWTLNGTTSATPDYESAADQAMACAGSSSNYLSIADGTAPEFGSDTFSMVFRVKSNATPDSTWHPFLSKWTEGQKSWVIGHADNYDTIEFWGVNSGSDWPPDVNLAHALGGNWSGTWLHVGLVRDGSSWKLYIDGSLADTETVSCTLYNGTSPMYGFKDGDGYVFNGALDDIAFFDEALTAANIAALAAAGSNFGGEGSSPGTTTPTTMGVSGPASVLGVTGPSHVMGVGD